MAQPSDDKERARAGLAQLRGHLAMMIQDPIARQRFIAQQGEQEALGMAHSGNIDEQRPDLLWNTAQAQQPVPYQSQVTSADIAGLDKLRSK